MSQSHAVPAPGASPEAILEEKVQEPKMFQVLIHNDDYTTMEFVVNILMTVFHKTADQATAIMLAVHKRGKGIAGVYPHEIAETKVERTRFLATEAGYPLRCTLEEVGV